MKVIKSPKRLNQMIRSLKLKGKRIGFVPTMGCLHEGHLSLVRRARRENNVVVVSLFVNPKQFGPKEDFKKYPRNFKKDKQFLNSEKINYLFFPTQSSIYPKGFRNYLEPGPLARRLCGAKRPGHFRGVVTVVNRFFEIVEPDNAYFGQKDYQQAKIIEDMVQTRRLNVRIKICPIVREKDGLAMSSRNRYLSKKERVRTKILYQSLNEARTIIRSGEKNPLRVIKSVRSILKPHVDKIDYIELVDPQKLIPLKQLKSSVLIALACFVGSTRLIDNLIVRR